MFTGVVGMADWLEAGCCPQAGKHRLKITSIISPTVVNNVRRIGLPPFILFNRPCHWQTETRTRLRAQLATDVNKGKYVIAANHANNAAILDNGNLINVILKQDSEHGG
jgi:hypothetical protein